MYEHLKAALLEATRLTRTGHLAEATAVIQRMLGQGAGGSAAAEDARFAHVDQAPSASRDPANPDRASAESLARAMPDAGWVGGRYVCTEGARDYRLYVPASAATGVLGRAPGLILMLHGCGQDADSFAAVTRMQSFAETQGCLLLFPTQALVANGAGCWNWHLSEHQQADRGEPAILAGMTRRILDDHALDRRRVYAAGLSAGGAMALTMAVAYPHLFAAVGVHSGLPYGLAHDMVSAISLMQRGVGLTEWGEAAPPGRVRIPAILFQGDADSTVHPANAELILAQVMAGQANLVDGAANGTRVEVGQVPGGYAYRRTSYLDDAGVIRIELWMVQGGGHGWFGGAPGAFCEPDGPDASREMMRFFMEHPGRAD